MTFMFPDVEVDASSGEGASGIDAILSSMLRKLQSECMDVTDDIDILMSRIVDALPSAAIQLEYIMRDSQAITKTLDSVSSSVSVIDEVNGEANATISTLKSLHFLRTNMSDCASQLAEAGNWNKLKRDIENAIRNKDYVSASTNISHLTNSVEIMRRMPEHTSREKTLELLQRKLEEVLTLQ